MFRNVHSKERPYNICFTDIQKAILSIDSPWSRIIDSLGGISNMFPFPNSNMLLEILILLENVKLLYTNGDQENCKSYRYMISFVLGFSDSFPTCC